MDRYELHNAVEKVDGYYIPSPAQQSGYEGGLEGAFLSAKAECLRQMQKQMDDIKSLSFLQFAEKKKLPYKDCIP